MIKNGTLFYVPEGEEIHIKTGNYRFKGPQWVKFDSSFRWPTTYVSGKPIVFLTEENFNEPKPNSNSRNDTSLGDFSVSGQGNRGPNKEGVSRDSSVREDSGEIGKPKKSGRKRGLDEELRGSGGEDSPV